MDQKKTEINYLFNIDFCRLQKRNIKCVCKIRFFNLYILNF